jgi:hypothetical protein
LGGEAVKGDGIQDADPMEPILHRVDNGGQRPSISPTPLAVM